MDATTLVNGQPSNTLDISDRGLAYGDGVFETIALSQGQVQSVSYTHLRAHET